MGDSIAAAELIRLADMPAIVEWTESLWCKGGPWSQPPRAENSLPHMRFDQRLTARMPPRTDQKRLLARAGFRCRFCGIPLLRAEMRSAIRKAYPKVLRWGHRNQDQHAAFQAMWLQYDHLIPHARGGTNDLNNLVVACAPCNNGHANLTLEEVGLTDPRERLPIQTDWDGLERFCARQAL